MTSQCHSLSKLMLRREDSGLHCCKPMAFASKSQTETESRYSNIEREIVGIVFGLERFHQYVYGRHLEVHTDNKPLESIYTKHLFAAPPRMARMLLRIQQYDVSIKYFPGNDIKLADALPRVNPCNSGPIRGLDLSVREVHMHLNASPTRIVEIRMETSKDSTLHALCEIISLGCPENIAHCPTHVMPFWNFRDELSVEDGLIVKGQRIILPMSLHAAALEQIHYAHQVQRNASFVQRQRSFGVVSIMTSTKWSNRVRHARHTKLPTRKRH